MEGKTAMTRLRHDYYNPEPPTPDRDSDPPEPFENASDEDADFERGRQKEIDDGETP